MNQCTQLQQEFATATSATTYRASGFNLPSSGADKSNAPTKLVYPEPVKSPRNNRISLAMSSFRREAMDSSFKKRMEAARKLLSEDIEEREPRTITSVRLSLGKTQAGLAASIGTSQPHIAKIEAGKVKLEFETATKIADSLQISLDEFRTLILNQEHKINNAQK